MPIKGENDRPIVSVEIKQPLRNRLESFADDHDTTRSDVIRDSLREYLPADDETRPGPKDPELREVYYWLLDRTDEHNNINSERAIKELSQNHGMKAGFIKSSLLNPLARAGWIEPNFGSIHVNEKVVADD